MNSEKARRHGLTAGLFFARSKCPDACPGRGTCQAL